MPFDRMASAISPQGANTRSHHMSGSLFMTPYRIRMPRLDMPISYTSGKQKAMRSFTPVLSLIISLYSPPV